MNQEEHKKYWDSIAGKKKFTVNLRHDLFFEFVKRDAEILDFGCGYGRTLAELAETGCKKLYGCDISPKMISQARNHIPAAKVSINSGLIIPFADASFDCVVVLAVLTSIISDADQAMLIKQIRRVLRPGGIVYVGDFLLNNDTRNLDRYRQYEEKYGRLGIFELDEEGGVALRHHSEEYIRQLFSAFEILKFEPTVYQTMNGNQSNGFYLVARNSDNREDLVPAEDTLELQFPELNLDDDPDLMDEVPVFEQILDDTEKKSDAHAFPADEDRESIEPQR